MKYLAVDYGTVRVGLAVNRLWLAEPLEVVPTADAFKRIQEIIGQEHIDCVLIGVADGKVAEVAQTFGKQLQKLLPGVQFREVDETASSRDTKEKMVSGTMSKSKRRQPMDHYAAATFLQEYLDSLPKD